MEASYALVHTPPVAGIAGSRHEGAVSVALSNGYEDNDDHGETFIFAGMGGRTRKMYDYSQPQIRNQTAIPQNEALCKNVATGKPVRVIRGYKVNSPYAPRRGYRYDGT